MSQFVPILVFAAVAILVVGGAIASFRMDRKRREALAALAADLGWSFDPAKDSTHDTLYARFEVFRRGHSRAAYNTLRGTLTIDGRPYPAQMGDFTYKVTTGSGKNRSTTTYRFSYLILRLPFAPTPSLLIRPENILDKLAGAVGFDDIDFESAEFSRRFFVKSSNKRFAYDVVHPRMMEFLLSLARPTAIDIEHGSCCLTDGARRWDVGQFRWHLGFAAQFFDHWPDHLTAELDARPGAGRPAP